MPHTMRRLRRPRRTAATTTTGTAASYSSGCRTFRRWCESVAACPLPASPATVVCWIAAVTSPQATPSQSLSISTVKVYLSAIRREHAAAGHPSPTLHPSVDRAVLARQLDREPQDVSLRRRDLYLAALPPVNLFGAQAMRDRALLGLVFAGGLGVGELRVLAPQDLTYRPQGLVIDVGGRKAVIRTGLHMERDPVQSVRDWGLHLRARRGRQPAAPLLRAVDQHGNVADRPLGHSSVSVIIKRLTGGEVTPHALSRGMLDALANGAPAEAVKRHMRRRGDVELRFRDGLSRRVGL